MEIRVVACLVEKQRTTPDQYPLTLNSLRLACNQSTNRDPVTDYDEPTIRSVLDRLGQRKWTTLASWSTARSVKYKHLFDKALGLSDPQLALITVLMLRGPQTPGELRQRTEGRELAVALPRRPGERGQRFAHRLGEVQLEEPGVPEPIEPPAGDGLATRVDRLEGEVAALREQLRALRDELGA